jgi:hypothetical protein
LWVQQLVELTLSEGMSAFFLYLVESADMIRRFAEEVVPEVREIVAKERGRGA